MKRFIALLMMAVLVLSLFAACGSTNNSDVVEYTKADGSTVKGNFTIPEGGYDGSEVTITFGHTMGANLKAVLDRAIEDFNKIYPNIHIEHSSYGGWADIAGLINTEIMGDNQPNIAYCYPDHVASYNTAKAVVVLDNFIASDIVVTREDGTTEVLGLTQEQIDDFIPGFYNEGKTFGDGLMYSLPMSKSTEVLYYNKTYFEENNLKVPETWEEMKALCIELKAKDPTSIPLGYDSEANWFITLAEQYGYPYTSATGDHFLFNNDQNKAFVKELREWYQDGLVTTQTLLAGAYSSSVFTELDKSKIHSYMSIGSTGGASYQKPDNGKFEVGVAPIPQVSESNKKVISQGPSLCILRGGKTTDQQVIASWLFVKFLTTDSTFQAEFSMSSGYMPVLKSVSNNETYVSQFLDKADGYNNLQALVVKVALEESDTYFTSPAFNGSTVAREQVESLLVKCLSESGTDVDKIINDAFQKAYDECEYQAG